MKTQKTRKFGKAVVAGLAAFMMLAEPFTASACPAEHHADAVECAVEEHCGVEGEVLYEAQFLDEDGNVYPVSAISPHVFCISHRKVDGYFQTHIDDGKGGCTVKTYKGVTCVICDTIWVGDLCSVTEFVKCSHDVK